jgi:predicted acetyltransferase
MLNSIIRKLTNDDIHKFIDIVINAYPGIMQNTTDFKERFYHNLVDLQENDDSINLFGLFRDNKLIGGMRIHHYKMNLFSQTIKVGGVGLVAVDLLHKKEKVAKELIDYFIHYFKELGISLVMLYPFRPDFYKKMGFGYGLKMNQYMLKPTSFPNAANKEGIIFLDESHKELIRDCYNRYASRTHGMIYKTNNQLNSIYKNPNQKLVGYLNDGKLEGYLQFSFEKVREDNFLNNNLLIKEYIYENPIAFAKLNSFLHTQADQIQRVILNSQDNSLQFLFQDPRNGSNKIIPSVYHETNTSGVGLMYRIIDIHTFANQLNHLNFNNVSCSFSLRVKDTFLSDECTTIYLSIKEGQLAISDENKSNFQIELEISDLSSLFMGAVDVNRLYQYGLLKIDNINYLETLEKLFMNRKEPICLTAF